MGRTVEDYDEIEKWLESVPEASRLSGWSSQSLWCRDQYYIVRRMNEAIPFFFFSSLHLSFPLLPGLSSQGEVLPKRARKFLQLLP